MIGQQHRTMGKVNTEKKEKKEKKKEAVEAKVRLAACVRTRVAHTGSQPG